MKGCISISLYGDAAKYVYGAVENARLAKTVYPGWTIVFHVDRGHPAIDALKREGAEVIEYDPEKGSGGMFWRFYSINDDRFTHVVIRDADSRLSIREKVAVDEWIESEKSLHVIRDHPYHRNRAIIGGAWGMRVNAVHDIRDLASKWSSHENYGDDEDFLGAVIWPRFYENKSFLRHCYECETSDDTPFPPHPSQQGHVCERVTPTFNEPFEAFVLSPTRYEKRRARFFESVQQNGGFLRDKIQWWKATTLEDRVLPEHFDCDHNYPHFYLASRDHIDILEQAVLKGTEYLFVFEDDAIFLPDFEEFLMRALAVIPDDWRALVLGGQEWTNHARSSMNPPWDNHIVRVSGTLGMHGTLWNRTGILRAFNHFTYWHRMVIDHAFAGLQYDEPYYYSTAKWVVDLDTQTNQKGTDQ